MQKSQPKIMLLTKSNCVEAGRPTIILYLLCNQVEMRGSLGIATVFTILNVIEVEISLRRVRIRSFAYLLPSAWIHILTTKMVVFPN